MESTSKVIFALNSLIEINDRRWRHYTSLVDKSRDDTSKRLFQQHAQQSQYFITSLHKWRSAYGASTYPEKRFNVFTITWTQLMGVFNSDEAGNVLLQCEEIENDALKIYKTAVALSFLPSAAIVDILKQTEDLEKAHENLKLLKKNNASSPVSVL